MEDRRARRRAAIVARKAATKARLAEPVVPPRQPVAIDWVRRPSRPSRPARRYADGFSGVISGDAGDLEGALEQIAEFVDELGPALGGRTRR